MPFASRRVVKKDAPAPAVRQPAQLAIYNTAYNVGALDFHINGEKVTSSPVSYAPEVSKLQATYLEVAPVNFKELIATDADDYPIIESRITLESNQHYSLFVFGEQENSEAVFFLLNDVLSTPAKGKAQLRILHLSTNTPAVDIELSKGTVVNKIATRLRYIGPSPDTKALEKFTPVNAGTFDLRVKTSRTPAQTLLEMSGVELAEGKSYTIYLEGLNDSSDPELGLQVIQHN
ncbi:DUF4397 domain-containing protein [Chitinophaga sp. MD30]|uniref:DUF4397 domain-containing protein n=1 Tax=Chitinophaga sp. MD30 TaxID=2033437 RepID=UPI000BB00CDA|nr:DUF4397 domain-containing protein [Chitinophaga sp. MD30]ASZ12754.1 hypothetical protein CK934_18230 [Chitinophaga sp. MD30]